MNLCQDESGKGSGEQQLNERINGCLRVLCCVVHSGVGTLRGPAVSFRTNRRRSSDITFITVLNIKRKAYLGEASFISGFPQCRPQRARKRALCRKQTNQATALASPIKTPLNTNPNGDTLARIQCAYPCLRILILMQKWHAGTRLTTFLVSR